MSADNSKNSMYLTKLICFYVALLNWKWYTYNQRNEKIKSSELTKKSMKYTYQQCYFNLFL